MLPFWPRRREIPRKPAGAREARFDCASRPGDRYGRSPGKNKASGRSTPFLRQGRQNDVWRRGEKAAHEVPAKIRGCQQNQIGSSGEERGARGEGAEFTGVWARGVSLE